ncbi:MAG: hypothetical protein IKM33_05255 [Clostridia bacterium]|nr:hypothetical protein [Clostridia bacterium]
MGHQKQKGTATQCLFVFDDEYPNRIPAKPQGLAKRAQDLWGEVLPWRTQGFRVPDGSEAFKMQNEAIIFDRQEHLDPAPSQVSSFSMGDYIPSPHAGIQSFR